MAQLLRSFGGVQVRRVIDRGGGAVAEHAHDWPVLSLFVLGAYRNTTELGEVDITGPSAVLYASGAPHANRVGPRGFEQIEIEFDRRWLGAPPRSQAPVSRWNDGPAGAAARRLARACLTLPGEADLRLAVRGFLDQAQCRRDPVAPSWLGRVDAMIADDPDRKVAGLARAVDRHPAWLGVAYARLKGESLPQTLARVRLERAAQRLRETDAPLAAIATEAGFCDQSHMIRTFRRLLGRTPTEVRADATHFRV